MNTRIATLVRHTGRGLLTAALLSASPLHADPIIVHVHHDSFEVISAVPGQGTPHATINLGETVRWVWMSDLHTVTSDTPGIFDSGIQFTGYIWEFTFDFDTGPFPYHCILHGGPGLFMAGSITVVEVPGCYANCDQSTIAPILNVDDFTCFINEFAGAQSLPHEEQIPHYANCDASTIAPVLNVDDFTCFINAFAQGCP